MVIPVAKVEGVTLGEVCFRLRLVEVGSVHVWYQGVGHATLSKVVEPGCKRGDAEVFTEKASIARIGPRVLEVVALDSCKQGVDLVSMLLA